MSCRILVQSCCQNHNTLCKNSIFCIYSTRIRVYIEYTIFTLYTALYLLVYEYI